MQIRVWEFVWLKLFPTIRGKITETAAELIFPWSHSDSHLPKTNAPEVQSQVDITFFSPRKQLSNLHSPENNESNEMYTP